MIDSVLETIGAGADAFARASWALNLAVIGLMVAARVGGLVLAMPALFATVPVRFRIALVLTTTVVLSGGLGHRAFSQEVSWLPLDLVMTAGRNVVLGMVIGATAQLIAIGIGLAGDVIAGATGLQLAQAADPSSGQMVPQLSRLITLLVTALMLSLGGHRLVLDALLGSFQAMPPLSVSLDASTLTAAVDHLSIGVSAGLHVAAPVVGCVLLSNVAVALVSRVAPQINVLAVGMNLNLLAALIVTALAIGSAGLAFEHELTRSLASLNLGGR